MPLCTLIRGRVKVTLKRTNLCSNSSFKPAVDEDSTVTPIEFVPAQHEDSTMQQLSAVDHGLDQVSWV